MILPDHIIKKSEVWYFNTLTQKWIHSNHIEDFCNKYWAAFDRSKEPKRTKEKWNKNVKAAARRWANED